MSVVSLHSDLLKVLLVDDSATVRERIKMLLADVPGLEVAGEAAQADEALAVYRRVNPDVVILDIRMPGGTGIGVLREIKRGSPAAVVVMLTNFATPEHRSVCLAAGADYFLDKSTEFWDVLDILQDLPKRRN